MIALMIVQCPLSTLIKFAARRLLTLMPLTRLETCPSFQRVCRTLMRRDNLLRSSETETSDSTAIHGGSGTGGVMVTTAAPWP
jgi:hypothetical protein